MAGEVRELELQAHEDLTNCLFIVYIGKIKWDCYLNIIYEF